MAEMQNIPHGARSVYSQDFTKGSILRNLLVLSWPMIVSNSLNVLGPTVDMIWIGRLGASDIAAVGVAGLVVMLVNALIMGLFTGYRSMVARRIGAQDPAGAINVARQAFVIATIYSIVLAAIGVVFAGPILDLLGLQPDVVALGASYLRINFVGMAAVSFRTMTDGTMQASGDTMTPMKISVIFRGLHLALCPFLVFGWGFFPELGIVGAAVTGVVSQSVGTAIGLWILVSGRSRLRLTFKGFRFDIPIILNIIKIGLPASVMSLQMQFGSLAVMRVVTQFGTLAVATHTLAQRWDMLLMMPLMGLGMSAGVLVGQNLGARQPQRAEKNGWVAMALSEGLMLLFSLVLFLGAKNAVRLFSSDPALDEIAATYLRIASAGYIVVAFSMVLQQCIAGAGDTIPPMIISIVNIWAIQIPLSYLFTSIDGVGFYGVRWAMVVSSTLGAIAYVIYYRSGRWKRKRV
jgi:putative MATE family efflux protein